MKADRHPEPNSSHRAEAKKEPLNNPRFQVLYVVLIPFTAILLEQLLLALTGAHLAEERHVGLVFESEQETLQMGCDLAAAFSRDEGAVGF